MGRISSCFMIFKSGGTLKYEMIHTMLTHIRGLSQKVVDYVNSMKS